MKDAYTQGFIDKCAEHGVDPEELAKQASLLAMYGPKIWARIKKLFGAADEPKEPVEAEEGHVH